MFKDLKVSLYDLFGYLLPGATALSGVGLATWALFYPDRMAILHGYDGAMVTAALGLAYLVGHVVQAGGNLLEKGWNPEDRFRGEIPGSNSWPAIENRIRQALSGFEGSLDLKEVSELCDWTNVAAGLSAERDIYEQRQGMYRGLLVAFTILTVGLGFAIWSAPLLMELRPEVRVPVGRGTAGTWLLLSVLSAVASGARYHRFSGYRVKEVFRTFAASQFLVPRKQEKKDPEKTT